MLLADVIHTFGFSLKEAGEFDWAELVRWHCQHQRITEEQAQLTQLTGALTTMTTFAGAGEGMDDG